jgi:antitoxin PrlF
VVDVAVALHYGKAVNSFIEISMLIATITSKGQITIPAEIRQALGLDAGTQIAFEELAPGKYAFVPTQKRPVTVLKGMFGKAKRIVSIEEMNAVITKRGASAK